MPDTVSFGYEDVAPEEKTARVRGVFVPRSAEEGGPGGDGGALIPGLPNGRNDK